MKHLSMMAHFTRVSFKSGRQLPLIMVIRENWHYEQGFIDAEVVWCSSWLWWRPLRWLKRQFA